MYSAKQENVSESDFWTNYDYQMQRMPHQIIIRWSFSPSLDCIL